DRAADGLSALPPGQRGDAALGYTERQFFFHKGDALVSLGDYHGADQSFAQSLRLYSPAEFLDHSLVRLGQARCRLDAGEPEEALRISRDTLLDLPREQRAEIIIGAARGLGESVAARHGNLAAVREYREALMTA
ncbi:MAG TPA: XRE family transcriptional regulator, partial [Streptosporangiaceae bacterium]